ncbi:MAG: SPASM domain-containing protein, partial [Candidatus Omnitrophica bacterium]|nr:SPASM domain-containing protein [Candidatus Omnitrophota bacterium]
KKMHCLMITNGFLLGDMAEDIVDSGLDELNISLDGGAKLHDEIRGMAGLFDRIMNGLQKINYFKTRKRKKRPYINMQCTITPANYLCLEQLLDAADKAGAASLTFHNLIFLSREILDRQKKYDALLDSSSAGWEGFVFEPGIEPAVLYEKMKKILSGKYRFRTDFYPNFSSRELKEYYDDTGYAPRAARCVSPWMCAYIFPDGGLRPCLNFEYSYGNIKENRFAELWNGKKAVRFRSLLSRDKSFPVCARCTELYRY